MTDYVIALRHPNGRDYYRDAAGRFWSNGDGLKRAQRFSTFEIARETVCRNYSIDAQRRFCVVPLAKMLTPTASAIV